MLEGEDKNSVHDTEDRYNFHQRPEQEPPSFYEDDIKKFKGKFEKSIQEHESLSKSKKGRGIFQDLDHNENIDLSGTNSVYK